MAKDGFFFFATARLGRVGLLSALLVAISSPGQAEPIDPDEDFDFTEEFADYDIHPPLYELEQGAVDITAIDTPLDGDRHPFIRSLGTGVASYYGRRFAGRKTANGERFDPGMMTAAHKTLPFGSMVRVTNPRNGRSVVVRINDRGPFVRGRVIDLSRAAADEIGMIRQGHARVQLDLVGG